MEKPLGIDRPLRWTFGALYDKSTLEQLRFSAKVRSYNVEHIRAKYEGSDFRRVMKLPVLSGREIVGQRTQPAHDIGR
jgi:hypothetical protein